MLVHVESGKPRTKMIFPGDYQQICAKMTPAEIDGVIAEINRIVDVACSTPGEELVTTSWMPGSNWDGTPFEPIWWACRGDEDAAAKAFGLFCWDAMMRRTDKFGYGHYELNGVPIRGMTYFRIS
jgi:hypothetical protein